MNVGKEETNKGRDCHDTGEKTEQETRAERLPTAEGDGKEEPVITQRAAGKAKESEPNAGKRGRPTKAEQLARASRQRANSLGTIEGIKRKREIEDEWIRENLFQQPSKRNTMITRSPMKKKEAERKPENATWKSEEKQEIDKIISERKVEEGEHAETGMLAAIMGELQKMRQEMKEEFNRDRTAAKADREEIRSDLNNLREEMSKRERKWEQKQQKAEENARKLEERAEKIEASRREREADMERRLTILEEKAARGVTGGEAQAAHEDIGQGARWKEKIERMDRSWEVKERRERRNIIVIRGRKWTQENEKEEVEKVIKEELGIEIEIRRVRIVGDNRTTAVAEMHSWEDKETVMRKKPSLRGKPIYVDNDYTKQEEEIQKALRRRMKEEREKGMQAKLGYMKIQINGKWWFWEEGREELRPDRNFREGGEHKGHGSGRGRAEAGSSRQ